MHTNVISANKPDGAVHHNDNISDSGAADFHGNGAQTFSNLLHDFVACCRSTGIVFWKATSRELADGPPIQKHLT